MLRAPEKDLPVMIAHSAFSYILDSFQEGPKLRIDPLCRKGLLEMAEQLQSFNIKWPSLVLG